MPSPASPNPIRPEHGVPLTEAIYREGNHVERHFNRRKQFRRMATRYDKLGANFFAFVMLASVRICCDQLSPRLSLLGTSGLQFAFCWPATIANVTIAPSEAVSATIRGTDDAAMRRIAMRTYVSTMAPARRRQGGSSMKMLLPRLLVPALLIATIPAGIVLAEAPAPTTVDRDRPSADMVARMQEGRIAMAKAALGLSDAQLKLWAPVEEQIRASLAERAKARQERDQARQEGAPRKDLADRLEQASQRMTQRAERMKAFSAAFKSLYASLTDEQKPLAGLVLRATGRGHHHRHFSHREQQ